MSNKKEDIKLRLKDGTVVPGATRITGQMDKSDWLAPWANRLGLKGIDSVKYTADAARRGDLIHTILESYVLNEEVELNMEVYSEEDINNSIPHLDFYKEWDSKHTVEPIWCEHSLVSEKYKYGGRIDFYAIVDGKYTIIDFKTSKAISEENYLQLSSYVKLFEENGLSVDQAMIINVGKNKEDKFIEGIKTKEELNTFFELFEALVNVYWIKKKIGYGESEGKKYDYRRTKKKDS